MRGSTLRYSRPPAVRQSSQQNQKPLDAADTRRLNHYGAGSGGINSASGRKTIGFAVATSTFSFGDDTELTGQDFTGRSWKEKDEIVKKRFVQSEARINRARQIKRNESKIKPQYYMGAKTGRTLMPDPMEAMGKENDSDRPINRGRKAPPVKGALQQVARKRGAAVPMSSKFEPIKSKFMTSPLREKKDAASKALEKYEQTLARVDAQVAKYHHEEDAKSTESDPLTTTSETTKALESHRKNLERAHSMQRNQGIGHSAAQASGKSLKERDPYLSLLLGRMENDLDSISQGSEEQGNVHRRQQDSPSQKKAACPIESTQPRLSLIERQNIRKTNVERTKNRGTLNGGAAAADMIKHRKKEEAKKRVESNCLRLARALKSNVVEIQLCVWDWQKTRDQKFKSKEVRKNKNASLRKDLSRRLSGHRRCIVNLIEAVREWQSVNKTKQSFLYEGEDVYRLIMRMPILAPADKDEDRTVLHDFSLAALSSDESIIAYLGFRPGNVARRSNGRIDTNPFLLPPFDLKRLAILSGNKEDAVVGDVGINDDEHSDEDDEQFPYDCADDMPLVCHICNVGNRDDNGICIGCGHVGGNDWRERDAKAREARFVEDLEFFEEDREQRKVEKKRRAEKMKQNKIIYDSQIGDDVLLKFNELNHCLMDYDFFQEENVHKVSGSSQKDTVEHYASKYDDAEEENCEEATKKPPAPSYKEGSFVLGGIDAKPSLLREPVGLEEDESTIDDTSEQLQILSELVEGQAEGEASFPNEFVEHSHIMPQMVEGKVEEDLMLENGEEVPQREMMGAENTPDSLKQGTNVVAEQQKHDDRSTHCEENSIFEEKNEDKASYGGAEVNDVPFENSNSPVSQLEKEQYDPLEVSQTSSDWPENYEESTETVSVVPEEQQKNKNSETDDFQESSPTTLRREDIRAARLAALERAKD